MERLTTKTIDVHNEQVQLDELLFLAKEGIEVILTDGDTPLARVVPLNHSNKAPTQRVAGLNQGAIWTSDDFDAPLPDEFWLGTEEQNETAL